MRHKYLFASLLAAFPLASFSQYEMRDSIRMSGNVPDTIHQGTIGIPDSISCLRTEKYHFTYNPALDPLFPFRTAYPLDFSYSELQFIPGQARLFHWNSGEVIASGGTRVFPGLMKIDSGAVGVYQTAGNFTFYAGGMVNKYGFFNGLHTQYGLNGSISYQFIPRLSVTLFGDYYFGGVPKMSNGMPMPHSMIGFYGRSLFGGYVDYRINNRWGVQTGVQTVQQAGTRKYKAEPIVTPYYKINKKVSIGLPVGQILYHVLKK